VWISFVSEECVEMVKKATIGTVHSRWRDQSQYFLYQSPTNI
jgi:hypothetical protein